PPYMVPTHWLAVAEWPLNPNGKIDRRQLRGRAEQAQPLEPLDDAACQPLNALEETLMEVCSELLPGQRIPLTRPLDQAGLDSILLLRLSFAIQSRLQLAQPIPLSVWL